jgi:hypothetical protein
VRDQAPSGFNPVLQRLCDAVAGSSAALVDAEGETVDYAGCLEPFDIRVAAAEWSLVVRTLAGTRTLDRGDTFHLCFRGKKRSFAVILLSQGYALVVETPAGSLLLSKRAVTQAVHEISIEAGLLVPETWTLMHERWTRVSVKADRHLRRPTAIWCFESWQPVTILGRIRRDQLGRSEAGYRIRIADEGETTLIREPFNRWYAEEWADFQRKP